MTYTLRKFAISAAVLVAVSEISKRSSFAGGLLALLPLTSLFVWLYRNSHDAAKISALSTSIFWLVLPSLSLLITPTLFLRKGIASHPVLGALIVVKLTCCGGMVLLLGKLAIKL